MCFQNGWLVFPCHTLGIPGASGSSAGTGTPCCSAHPVALPSPEGKGSSYHRKSWYPLERGEWKFIYCRDLLILANSHDGSSHVDKLQAGKKMLFCCCCCCFFFFVFFCRGMKEELGWYSPTGSSLIMVESTRMSSQLVCNLLTLTW